jgi:hypothetical protein
MLTPDKLELLAITAYHARKQALRTICDFQQSTKQEWDNLDEDSKEIYRQEVAAVIAMYEEEQGR